MKVVGVAVARTGADLNEPIPLTVTNDLSSFGFFQRQVSVMPYRECECSFLTVNRAAVRPFLLDFLI